jgi:hypothetical protein
LDAEGLAHQERSVTSTMTCLTYLLTSPIPTVAHELVKYFTCSPNCTS